MPVMCSVKRKSKLKYEMLINLKGKILIKIFSIICVIFNTDHHDNIQLLFYSYPL